MNYDANEEITISFKSLKQAQNEAFQDGIAFAKSQIQFYLAAEADREKILNFLELIKKTELYSVPESCECEEDCGVEGCEAGDEYCCAECEELA